MKQVLQRTAVSLAVSLALSAAAQSEELRSNAENDLDVDVMRAELHGSVESDFAGSEASSAALTANKLTRSIRAAAEAPHRVIETPSLAPDILTLQPLTLKLKRATPTLKLAAVAQAMEVAREEVAFEITAPSMARALIEFTQQSGLQMLMPTSGATDVPAPRIVGSYTPKAALDQLLAGTDLRYEFANERTVAIRTAEVSSRKASPDPSQGEGRSEEGVVVATTEEPSTTPRPPTPDAGPKQAIPEILVRGSRSLNVDIERSRDDIQPYVVLNREAIQRSGASDMAELLRKSLPANSSTINTATSGTVGNVTNITLRGLGAAETLILIDGRRAGSYSAGGAAQQPDLNSIPLSAIERIEILPMSGSGIYGGNATGGVVNVILKRDYKGLDIAINHDNTFESDSSRHRADLNTGFSFNEGRTTFQLSGSYADSNFLSVEDRDFYVRGIQTILRNNPSQIYGANVAPPLAYTTNIRSNAPLVGGIRPNLTLKTQYGGGSLNSPFTYVPLDCAGVQSANCIQGLMSNAGSYNLDLAQTSQTSNAGNKSLLSKTLVKSARGALRHEFSNKISAFLELSGATNRSVATENPISTVSFLISRSAPNNPFNQDVMVTTPAIGADSTSETKLEDIKGVAGLVIRLPPDGWLVGLDHTRGRTRLTGSGPAAGISSEGSTSIRNGTIDVLRDTNVYPVDFARFVVGEQRQLPVNTAANDSTLRIGGPVLSLASGNVDLSFQASRFEQRIDDARRVTTTSQSVQEQLYPSRSQVTESLYSELRVPLISPANPRYGLRLLELQLAGRFDDYTSNSANLVTIVDGVPGFAETRRTNKYSGIVPTYGFRFSPINDVIVRASYSEGFLPPALNLLVPSEDRVVPGGFPALLDPRRGNTPVMGPITVLQGGNPDLRPETSSSESLGLVWTPQFVPGLRFSWDWARIDKKGNIGAFSTFLTTGPIGLQAMLQNEHLLADLVVRAPAQNDGFEVGPIIALNSRVLNFARANVEEYDWALDYARPTERFGTFSFSGSATQRVHSQTQTTPSAQVSENAAQYLAPRWSATSVLTWEYRGTTVSWSSQYLAPFFYLADHSVDVNQGDARAPSAVYHDLSVSYRVARDGAQTSSWISGTELLLGIKNVFDKPPRPLVGTGVISYDRRVDPRLRAYYVTIRKSF